MININGKTSRRIAIVDLEKCKPKKCNKECKKKCPVEAVGKQCVDIETTASIVESSCIGCGICVSACPFGAISIVNIPNEMKGMTIHRFCDNGFRLYNLPILKVGCVNGIIGENGIGKSTVIKILAGCIKPNFEEYGEFHKDGLEATTDTIKSKFRGSETYKYLDRLYSGKLKISIKPQNIDIKIKSLKLRGIKFNVGEYITNELKVEIDTIKDKLIEYELYDILKTPVIGISGGEMQRLTCFLTAMKDADVYIFDEPTNFLDVKQRLKIANLISSLQSADRYVIVIEHDLAILDYVSDYITIMYGYAGAYGVSSLSYGTSQGINYYFDGFIRPENMRFRNYAYDFKELGMIDTDIKKSKYEHSYEDGEVNYPLFNLKINKGTFPIESSMTVILGENGTGKTTFLNYLKDKLSFTVSYKPQYLDIEQFKLKTGTYLTVQELFDTQIRESYYSDIFKNDVVNPLNIKKLLDRRINELSGGELQRVYLIYCLGKNAQVYLIDEPSANLDIEQRFKITKIIKRFVLHNSKIAFVVEHDMMMATSMAQEENSRVIVFNKEIEGGIRKSTASEPLNFTKGINEFLKSLNITFRTESTDAKRNRPKINKLNSLKDREQKTSGKYYT